MSQAGTIDVHKRHKLRRKQPSVWVRHPLTVAFYALGYLLTRVLAAFGKWPQVLGGDFARRHDQAKAFTPTASDVLVCSYFKSWSNRPTRT